MNNNQVASFPSLGPKVVADAYRTFIVRLSGRDLANALRHASPSGSESSGSGGADTGHAALWRRLAGVMGALAPGAVKAAGNRAVQFFVPDGAYQRQVFALEDCGKGALSLYMPDVTAEAVATDLLCRPVQLHDKSGGVGHGVTSYEACGSPGSTVAVEQLTARGTEAAPDYYRHMLGWNRTAIRVTVGTRATSGCVRALESLCALAARHVTAKTLPGTARTWQSIRVLH